ncbi:flagellar biosynthesis protein FlhF [Evansella cellulosilytica]|uniref:Flagellar biosynthesis protein FlhF n=1 Tax=Evansella cellulosilytica (strain ATCC 21833 / DSM 2522 / FERM P-1141 / JCM 9156 / N-4) TaxID=649639 RepID=E6TSU7_EVAC2|nr:flagellar biosynthesis protein FlhF [Evansella cellulosilytica]ADU30739.1 flagellar biosynthetic protein FlhF [Evansella cellulosilytica DSM 2522]
MKVKKYTAKNMPEAMAKIRAELGNDAVILNSKRVDSGGFLGFFTKSMIEVIAAIDPEIKQSVKRKTSNRERVPKSQVASKSELAQEINQIKQLIEQRLTTYANSTDSGDYPGHLKEINELLNSIDVEDVSRLQVMKQLLKRWYSENGDEKSKETIHEWTKEIINDLLSHIDYSPFNYKKRFLNVVGPTGVGKTTTLAKIAAKIAISDGRKVAFITTDTYRIAAIEQLKTYAKILNVPVEVVYSIEDFKNAKDRLSEYDVILVDSAGRNFLNDLYVKQLGEVIDFNEEMETHLVLSLTSKYNDMKKIIDQFQAININKVIFTKADETQSHGAMLNVALNYGIGSSYITFGQNVPDDIALATKEKVVEQLLGS